MTKDCTICTFRLIFFFYYFFYVSPFSFQQRVSSQIELDSIFPMSSVCMFYRETFPISRTFSSYDSLSHPTFRMKQQKLAGTRPMATGQKLCIQFVRSRITIYNYLRRPQGRGSFFRREMQDWPRYVVDRHPHGNLPRSSRMSRQREGRANRRDDFMMLLARVEICPNAIRVSRASVFLNAPGVRTHRETGSSKRRTTVPFVYP